MARSGVAVRIPDIACQLVMFSSDSVQADYEDGSRLLMSACGANCVHQTNPCQHVLQGVRCIRQKTRFSTSDYRARVMQALEFRNRFAERPYICAELVQQQPEQVIMPLYSDVTEVKWPTSLGMASHCCRLLDSGQVLITSLDKFACLTLSTHGQDFTVQYLAMISQDKSRKTQTCIWRDGGNSVSSKKRPLQELKKQSVTNKSSSSYRNISEISNQSQLPKVNESSKQRSYVWQIQHHSIHLCPDCWKHPLSLAQQVLQTYQSLPDECTQKSGIEMTNKISRLGLKDNLLLEKEGTSINDKENYDPMHNSANYSCASNKKAFDDISDAVASQLPTSLPLNCANIHLHKEALTSHCSLVENSLSEFSSPKRMENIKVICSAGVVYRFVDGTGVEVLPGDGSIMKSFGSTGCYYQHYLEQRTTGSPCILERTYSVKSPPPDSPELPYSVSKLISRADRLLKIALEERLMLSMVTPKTCWKMSEEHVLHSHPPTHLLQEMHVPRLGHFRAYSSGRVRIVFEDRASLEMFHDFRHPLSKSSCKTDYMMDSRNHPNISKTLPDGICRLLLPNGVYQTVETENPGIYYRYTSLATEWCSWVNSSPKDREQFYSQRPTVPSVEAELLKIKAFNYILENSGSSDSNMCDMNMQDKGHQQKHSTDCSDFSMVHKALHQSSQWLEETDRLLKESNTTVNT